MVRTFLNSLRVPEIRKKLVFTAAMLALYRVGAYIPAPSINIDVVKNFTFGRVFVIVMTLTAGTILLMWFGELITQRGIGNGISLMIFASIAARIPNGISSWWNNPDQVFKVMMPFVALAVIAFVV